MATAVSKLIDFENFLKEINEQICALSQGKEKKVFGTVFQEDFS